MTSVVVTATAARNLASLIETHSLPPSTPERIRASLDPLRQFPLLGAPLAGRWAGYRFILGPWRWLLIVYRYDETQDRVEVLTIQDGRSARSATQRRPWQQADAGLAEDLRRLSPDTTDDVPLD